MKFVVSSTKLLSHLQAINRVISGKHSLPILDNFLFKLDGNTLEITASDLETTLITRLELENAEDDGSIALPAKILNDTLKEFPEQPLSINADTDSYQVEILSENGKFNMMGQEAMDYPKLPSIDDNKATAFTLNPEIFLKGINKTIFATADDELRPVMNSIFIELSKESLNFVSSDSHKLVRYKRFDIASEEEANFMLPKKPATLLKNILSKVSDDIVVKFDEKNAYFDLGHYTLICRLTEGKYPSYEAVIPANNPNKMTIDRVSLYNSLKRVAVFSNQASNLIKLKLENNLVTISAQDLDFSISAYEKLNCQFDGDDMEIGFKSTFLTDILNNMSASDIIMQMSDPGRAAVLVPLEKEVEEEDELMLIMPLMIGG